LYFWNVPLSIAIDWAGTVSVSDNGWLLPLDAALRGSIDAGRLSLDFTLLRHDDLGCPFVYRMEGARRLPSASAIDNDYRMHVESTGDCLDKPVTSEDRVELISQDDGTVLLRTSGRVVPLARQASNGTYVADRSNQDG